MKTVIGVYESHEKAIAALKELQKSGYTSHQLSIMGKAELINNHVHIRPNDNLEKGEISIGAAAGTVVGILTGVGILAIPGFGILYGGGAFLGALFGGWTGYISGGIIAIFTGMMGMDKRIAARHEKHLIEGKFLVFVQGDEDEIKRAKHILHTQGLSIELNAN